MRDPTVAAVSEAVWLTAAIWVPSCTDSWLTAASCDVSVWSTAVRLLIWPLVCTHRNSSVKARSAFVCSLFAVQGTNLVALLSWFACNIISGMWDWLQRPVGLLWLSY